VRALINESSFIKAKAQLAQWLKDNTEYRQAGDAYAVFWDAPFMPWFLKRSEVHIAVQKTGQLYYEKL